MGVRHNLKWALVWACVTTSGGVQAQTAGSYSPVNAAADPRGASKASQGYGTAPGTGSTWQGVGQSQGTYGQSQGTYGQSGYGRGYAPARAAQGSAAQGYAPRAQAQAYVLAPPVLPYHEGAAPPSGYVLNSHRNKGLMTGGGLTWGGAYAAGLVYAMGKSFDNGTGWLAAPLVGPWAAIGGRDFKCKSSNNVTQKEIDKCVDGALNEVTSITFLAMMGLVQAVGATLFFVGVGDTTREWVRADLAKVQVSADAGPVGDSAYGLNLSGRF